MGCYCIGTTCREQNELPYYFFYSYVLYLVASQGILVYGCKSIGDSVFNTDNTTYHPIDCAIHLLTPSTSQRSWNNLWVELKLMTLTNVRFIGSAPFSCLSSALTTFTLVWGGEAHRETIKHATDPVIFQCYRQVIDANCPWLRPP